MEQERGLSMNMDYPAAVDFINANVIYWQLFLHIVWLRFIFSFKNSSIMGKQKNERMWWVATFLTLIVFDSMPTLTFFILGPAIVFTFYGVFFAVSDLAADVAHAPDYQLRMKNLTW